MIRRSQRGRLKVYLGYGPGVGKTYQMLTEGQRLKADGIDVVLGVVETHGRADTEKMIQGLEVFPRRKIEYRGIVIEEMDIDGLLARKPQVALVDELAHTNAPDSRNSKRYQDVQELLAEGIHVISTMNVQHLESLYNTVEHLLGVKVRERVPDAVLADADEVVNIDLAAEDLQRRLREGKVYPMARAGAALENFFTQSNLEHLRELTFREVASQLDFRRREGSREKSAQPLPDGAASDQVMVCLSSRGPNSAKLLRYGSRLAGRLNRNWYAVYVQTPSEEPTVIDATTQRLLGDTLTLANQLGATVFTFKGQDVADTILRFAREYRVGNIVIGRPRPIPWHRRLLGNRSVAEQLVHRVSGASVIVVDAEEPAAETVSAPAPTEALEKKGAFNGMLTPDRVLIWNDPVSRDTIFRQLVGAIVEGISSPSVDVAPAGTNGSLASPLNNGLSKDLIVARIHEREQTGSTFLNEGVALPHARIEGLAQPQIALGLTHAGVLDSPIEKPIEAIFMLLSPAEGAATHLQMLARAGRILQNRDLRRRLSRARTSEDVVDQIADWEQANAAPAVNAK